MELKPEWHNKKSISLYGLTQLALIILGESNVFYTNQAGGYSCCQPTEEGWLAIIGEDYDMSKKVADSLGKYVENKVDVRFLLNNKLPSMAAINSRYKQESE